jgi:thioredoxin-like negative regulator of GroEL
MGVKAEQFGPDSYDSCANRVKKLTGIILIFHPGCGHCVQMRPEWESMKSKLSKGSSVVEVDGSEMSGNESINRSPIANTRGFPEIMNMRNGAIVERYSGPRTADEMKKFAEKGMKRPSKAKKTKKNKIQKRKTGKRR